MLPVDSWGSTVVAAAPRAVEGEPSVLHVLSGSDDNEVTITGLPRAITLDRDEIAIHGTTRAMRASVGTAASYGCIRMFNEDVIDLFDRIAVGSPVMMTP